MDSGVLCVAPGAIMIGGQRIQLGLPHTGKTAEVTIEADTYQITGCSHGGRSAAPCTGRRRRREPCR